MIHFCWGLHNSPLLDWELTKAPYWIILFTWTLSARNSLSSKPHSSILMWIIGREETVPLFPCWSIAKFTANRTRVTDKDGRLVLVNTGFHPWASLAKAWYHFLHSSVHPRSCFSNICCPFPLFVFSLLMAQRSFSSADISLGNDVCQVPGPEPKQQQREINPTSVPWGKVSRWTLFLETRCPILASKMFEVEEQ